jgi:NADH-quinone oxidoreductase subunit N
MNTLIAIIGLGVLCLLFELSTYEKDYSNNCNLLAILNENISEFNSPYILQQYDY